MALTSWHGAWWNRAAALLAVASAGLVLSGCFLDPAIGRERVRREALDLYTRGLDLEGRGEYAAALDLYLQAIDSSPRPAFYYHAGVCHARLGHDDRALEFLDRALAMDAEYAMAQAERDAIAQRLAIEASQRREPPPSSEDPVSTSTPTTSTVAQAGAVPAPQVETIPDDAPPSAEDVRAVVFPELYGGRGDEASKTSEVPQEPPQRLEFPPKKEEQARLARQSVRLEQAAYYLENEVKAHPDDWELRVELAGVLARSGRLARAESELREAARLAPDREEVWYAWGGFYVRQENWPEADRCYRECLRINPTHARALNNHGVVLLRMGMWEEAERRFLELVKTYPDFPSGYLNLAVIAAQYRENLDEANRYAEEYLRLEGPRSAEVREWRQNLLLQRGPIPEVE